MPLLIDNPKLVARMLRRRRLSGLDRYDEVWDGVYIMSPLASDEHQRLVTDFATVLKIVIGFPGLGDVRAGVNVSDRARGWKKNYRIPDVAVRLNGGLAKILKNHWVGGPDFAIEIVSPGDRSRQKLDFYAAIGTRELLIVDADPWSLELYALRHSRLVPTGVSSPRSPVLLTSEVVPLTFRLIAGDPAPQIEAAHPETGQSWRI
jgi:Uma2 family endonuclease